MTDADGLQRDEIMGTCWNRHVTSCNVSQHALYHNDLNDADDHESRGGC